MKHFFSTFIVVFALLSSTSSAQEITIAMHYGQAQQDILEPCFAAYEAQNPGVNIVYQQLSYSDYLQTVLTSRIGGQAPDIYHLYNIWGAQLVENDVLATPPQAVLNFIDNTYVGSTVNAVTIRDQVWGVPTEVSNYLLVYNRQLLEAAGVAVPTTWNEVVEAAAAITERNDQGNITTMGYAFGPSVANVVHPFLTLLYSQGVEMFTEDYSATNLTSETAVAVLEQQVRLFEEGITDRSIEVWDFPSGSVGMMTMAPWYEQTLREGFGDAFEDIVGVTQIPGGDDWRSLQYAFFFGVDANSPNQEVAWDVITWLNTQQDEGTLSCVGQMLVELGALTSHQGDIVAAQDALGDSYSAPFIEALDRSITEPTVVQAAEIERILQTYIEQAWAGELEPAEALRQADREISSILAEFY